MQAFRGAILHCLDDPGDALNSDNVEFYGDGLLLVVDGQVQRLGDASTLMPELPEGIDVQDYRGKLILPGFIDSHIHFSQTDMIASYGEQLLDWLEKYAFPTERRFEDADHAAEVAEFFVDELLRNGTTTALVLGTVHPQSVDAIFRGGVRQEPSLDRRQGADGSQLSRGYLQRHAGLGVSREQGADRALASAGPTPVRDYASVCADIECCAAGARQSARARISGCVYAHPRCREQSRGELGCRTLSRKPKLSRRL